MADMFLYRLETRAPFHFGGRGVGIEATEEVFHSDSLFSALATGIRLWRGGDSLQGFLSRFAGGQTPAFRLTSLFPYAGDVLLFPRPMLRIEGGDRPDTVKRLKNVRFVSQDILLALIRREALAAELVPGNLLQEGSVWVSTRERAKLPGTVAEEAPVLWRRAQTPRVTVDRLTGASQVYRAGRVTFSGGCGLWFLLEAAGPEDKALVDSALDYLSEAGLGGERALGCGRFRVGYCQAFPLPWPATGDAFITLSLYHPTLEELEAGILAQPAAYDLVQRKGWIGSPERGSQRRRAITCLTEGSLLRSLGRSCYGDLAEVTPGLPGDHPVFRYGFAFPVPVVMEAEHGQ